ncbi:ABC transporter ATP-binding protein [Streptomyces bohaiensis]|uniref:ABC transporter ATP-binding protein n=1 Tax=Streptomyces bohaiensis TaxID=1431344 RepID=A0ABX1C7J0_9ACTN|nr:ABC transporter ATP-binding protein [Streptomyces bohaiensis]NJQ15136.1 ABC transporter ATP-binding protein [Streptomyces bohaiensis]
MARTAAEQPSAGPALGISGLRVTKGGRRILDGVTFDVPHGSVVGVIGPNGAGKSTLLSCVYRHTSYEQGVVRVDGRDVRTLPRRELARLIAAVPQDTAVVFDLTVEEIVTAGRIPHAGPLGRSRESDREVIDRCLRRVDLEHHRHRSVATLSGGERQRAFLARALAQEAPLLILDEPTNHLDLANQEQLLGHVRDHRGTVLIAVHDLNLAAEHCDLLVVLAGGRTVRTGTPDEVLTPDLLTEVFGVDAHVVPHPDSGHPHMIIRSRAPGRARAGGGRDGSDSPAGGEAERLDRPAGPALR